MIKSQLETAKRNHLNSYIDTKNTHALVKYFQLVEFKFKKMDNFGLSLDDAAELYKGKNIYLRDLFVPPHLSDRYLAPEQIISAELQSTPNWQNIVDVIKRHPRCFILGDPGAGKTTLAHWLMLALSYSDNNLTKMELGELVPFALILRELPLQDIKSFDDLWRVFTERNQDVMQAFVQFPESFDVIKTLLNSGQALILLDGLDEITHVETRQHLVNAVRQGMHDYPNCKFLISSRVVGFDQRLWLSPDPSKTDSENCNIDIDLVGNMNSSTSTLDIRLKLDQRNTNTLLPVFYLAPFTYSQAEQFVSNWYKQYHPNHDGNHEKRVKELLTRTRKNDGLGRLSRTPVLLNMICFIHARRGRLPDGRAELYQRIAETYLVGLDTARGIKSGGGYLHNFDYADRSDWLSEIALIMQTNRSEHDEENSILISENKVREILTQKLNAFAIKQDELNEEIDFLLIQFAQRSGLFLPRGKGENNEERYGFSHLSFLEYFAARALKPKLDLEQLRWKDLIAKTNLDWWQETFILFFEQIENSSLVEKYIEKLFPANSTYTKNRDDTQSLLASIVMDSGIKLRESKRKEIIELLWGSYVKNYNRSNFDGSLLLQRLWQSEYDALKLGIEKLESVDDLDLSMVEVFDLSVISRLLKLKYLVLQNNQVSDLSPLAGLTNVSHLTLDSNQITDLSPLAEMTKLTLLFIENNRVSDLSPLAGLKTLQVLFLGGNKINDISALSQLTRLRYLSLFDNQVSDISALSELKQLTYLGLSNNQVSDLSPLPRLAHLNDLVLDNNKISNVSVLAQQTKLTRLSLSDNQIDNISALKGLTDLRSLSLNNNKISDISMLVGLLKLEQLSLSNNQIADISALKGLTDLRSLSLDNNKISDLSVLAGLSKLERLSLSNNQIHDLSVLAKLPHLEVLMIRGNQISDFSALAGLTKLKTLDLNEIDDSDMH